MRKYFITVLVSILSLSVFATNRSLVCTNSEKTYSFPLLTLTEARERQDGDAVVLHEVYEEEKN